jgi:hypothetical protein
MRLASKPDDSTGQPGEAWQKLVCTMQHARNCLQPARSLDRTTVNQTTVMMTTAHLDTGRDGDGKMLKKERGLAALYDGG